MHEAKAKTLMRTRTRTRIITLAAVATVLAAALPAGPAVAETQTVSVPAGVKKVRADEEAILAPTLDELFRDSLRRENEGELPGFVQNKDGVRLLGPAEPPPPPPPGFQPPIVVYEEEPPAPPPSWETVVAAVARNAVEPVHVAEVERLADGGRGEAVELLAWMRANGVGVGRDLPAAFRLYTRAHTLGVPNARENAIAVFRSMSEAEQQAARVPF